MPGRALFWLALLSLSAAANALEFGPVKPVSEVTRDAYAPLWTRSVVPDGKGGAIAFSRLAKGPTQFSGAADIIATPVDGAGMPHPERAVVVATNASATSNLAAVKTADGYLVSMSNTHGYGYIAALRDDFLTTTQPVTLGNREPYPLVCNGDVCAGVIQGTSLLLLDSRGTPVREISMPGIRSVAPVSGGGFATAGNTRSEERRVGKGVRARE